MLKYYLAEDTIDFRDVDQLAAWLKSYPRLTKDKLTVEFEEKWSRWFGRKYSVFVNSGSSANLLMYYALLISGRLRNKKVIVPSAGWVTSVAPAVQFGFEPLMCEADPDTFGLDLNHLESLLEKHRPGAVMLVQVLGVPHKMPAILKLREKYGFLLMEDACASVGSQAYGKKTGGFGDLAAFSLYFGHQASTIEGGVISTDDKGLYDLLVMLRSHGWSKDLDAQSHDDLVRKYEVDDFHRPFVFYEPGFNLRSTDLNAFLGLGQLERLAWVASRRHENHQLYGRNLGERFTIQKWDDPQAVVSSIHFAVIAESGEERRTIAKALDAKGIETRMYTAGNLGLHPFWYNRYGKASFPLADRLYHCGFFLPNHPSLKTDDVNLISDVVLGAVLSGR